MQQTRGRHTQAVPRQNRETGCNVPLQNVQGHTNWFQTAAEVRQFVQGWLHWDARIGDGEDVPPMLPEMQVGYADQVFDVEMDGQPVYRDDLTLEACEGGAQEGAGVLRRRACGQRGRWRKHDDGRENRRSPSGGSTLTKATNLSLASDLALWRDRSASLAKKRSSRPRRP